MTWLSMDRFAFIECNTSNFDVVCQRHLTPTNVDRRKIAIIMGSLTSVK